MAERETLLEQVTAMLDYIDQDPDQTLIPDGRVRELRETLGGLAQPSSPEPEELFRDREQWRARDAAVRAFHQAHDSDVALDAALEEYERLRADTDTQVHYHIPGTVQLKPDPDYEIVEDRQQLHVQLTGNQVAVVSYQPWTPGIPFLEMLQIHPVYLEGVRRLLYGMFIQLIADLTSRPQSLHVGQNYESPTVLDAAMGELRKRWPQLDSADRGAAHLWAEFCGMETEAHSADT